MTKASVLDSNWKLNSSVIEELNKTEMHNSISEYLKELKALSQCGDNRRNFQSVETSWIFQKSFVVRK